MMYSNETSNTLTIIFLMIVTIGAFFLYKIKNEDENCLFIKLIGYIIISSFPFKLELIILPIGLVLVLFVYSKAKKNKPIKFIAIIIGLILFFLRLLPIDNNIENFIYTIYANCYFF